ncbi:hypothetical protein [Haloferax mucosum]|uniref:hypothetical protein n=1 Tax=Haloferax mucosum TaxID=403181 RepID=UPI00126753B2|nr:hypothetical protein [Haloferax mucosum]
MLAVISALFLPLPIPLRGGVSVLILIFMLSTYISVRVVSVAAFPGFRKTEDGLFEILLPCLECETATSYVPNSEDSLPKHCANCGANLSVSIDADDEILSKVMSDLDNGKSIKFKVALFNSKDTAAVIKHPEGNIDLIRGSSDTEIRRVVKDKNGDVCLELETNQETMQSIEEGRLDLDIVLAREDTEWNIGVVDRQRGLIGTIGPYTDYNSFLESLVVKRRLFIEMSVGQGKPRRTVINLSEIDLGKIKQLQTFREYSP